MNKYVFMFFNLILSVFTFGNMSISPYEFDFDLLKDKERVFTLVNTGENLASYSVELEKKMPISRYMEMKNMRFILSPGEKKEFKVSINNFEKREPGEFLGKLKILEEQKIKNMNYEVNTGITLYGYIGELDENFIVNTLEKDLDNILIGEIRNTSKRKIDILIKGKNSLGEVILTKKIRILRGKSFNLLDLGNLDELSTASKIIFETKDMKKEFIL